MAAITIPQAREKSQQGLKRIRINRHGPTLFRPRLETLNQIRTGPERLRRQDSILPDYNSYSFRCGAEDRAAPRTRDGPLASIRAASRVHGRREPRPSSISGAHASPRHHPVRLPT